MSPLHQLLAVGAAVLTVLAAPAIPNVERACEPLPHGHGLIPRPDTAEAFQSFPAFSLATTSAITPIGYIQAYSNLLTTFNEPSQFVRYIDLDSYDVNKCAAECNKDGKCNIFGIFFERTPMYKPGPKCSNPSSSTMIKCTLWSGTILPKVSINNGQLREQFRIVMAGSNAYIKDITFSNRKDGSSNVLKNWVVEKYQNGGAIQVPLDCNGADTYMGMAAWHDGRFDAQRCLDSCKVAGDSDLQSRKCRFVNTYIQRRNGVPVAQHCAMFSEYWPALFATNLGQRRGDVQISETDSYGLRRVDVKGTACYNFDNLLVPVPRLPSAIPDVPVVSTPASISASPSSSKPAIPPVGSSSSKPAALPVIASSLKPTSPTPVSSSSIPPKAQVSATGIKSQAVTSSKIQSQSSSMTAALSTFTALSAKAPVPNISAPTSVASNATSKVSGTPSVALSTSLRAPVAPSKAQVTLSGTTVTPAKVLSTPSIALDTPSILPATSPVVPATSLIPIAPSTVPVTSSSVLSNSSVAIATSPVVPVTPSAALSTSSPLPDGPSAVSASSSVALATSSVAPLAVPATPSISPTTPSVLPAALSVTPSTPLVPGTSSVALKPSSQFSASPLVTPGTSTSALGTPTVALATPSAAPSTAPLSLAVPTTPSAIPTLPIISLSPFDIFPVFPTNFPTPMTSSIEPRHRDFPLVPRYRTIIVTASLAHSQNPPIKIYTVVIGGEDIATSPVTDSANNPSATFSAHFASPATSTASAPPSTVLAFPTAAVSEPIVSANPVSPSPSLSSFPPSSSPLSPRSALTTSTPPAIKTLPVLGHMQPLMPYKPGRICWPSDDECWMTVNPKELVTDPDLLQEEYDPEVDRQKWKTLG